MQNIVYLQNAKLDMKGKIEANYGSESQWDMKKSVTFQRKPFTKIVLKKTFFGLFPTDLPHK